MKSYSLAHLADHVLLRDLAALVSQDRVTTAEMLAHLAEVDERRLHVPAGYPSMFAYCVAELRLSEDAAFRRIRAARAARRFPAVLPAVAAGRLNLNSVLMLAPHLAPETADDLLASAAHKTKAEIESLLARRFPRPDVVTLVQAVPPVRADLLVAPHVEASSCQLAPAPVAPSAPALSPMPAVPLPAHARVAPLSPGRYALQVTLAQDTHDKLRYALALLGHAVPSGDVAQVLDRALDALILRLEQRRFAATARPRPGQRRDSANLRLVPAAVKREVWERDGGRCTFVSEQGHRCESRTRLEFDHVTAVARGGASTADNLRLRCRAHNQFAAEQAFGAGFMRRKRDEAARAVARQQAAARAREAEQARREARARELAANEAARARALEVIPWLRTLGFRADEARRSAARCEALPEAPLEERVRFALKGLAPASARRVAAVASNPG